MDEFFIDQEESKEDAVQLETFDGPLEGWQYDAETGDIFTPCGYVTHAQHIETALWLLSANVRTVGKKPIYSDEPVGHVDRHMYDVGDLKKRRRGAG